MKTTNLRNKTEGYLGIARSFEEYYTIGKELENVGKLIQDMAAHMNHLQNKVDAQATELRRLNKVEERTNQPQVERITIEDLLKRVENNKNSTVKPEEKVEEIKETPNSEFVQNILNDLIKIGQGVKTEVSKEPRVERVQPKQTPYGVFTGDDLKSLLEVLNNSKIKPYPEAERKETEARLKEVLDKREKERVERINSKPRVEHIKNETKAPNMFELFPGMVIGMEPKVNSGRMNELEEFLKIFGIK